MRAALEASGLDHGPISVHDKMLAMGLDQVPSTASLARIFREAGVARLEPKKKPRSAWRRFVYPAPNACWQLDATEYVLTGGRKCVIFQLIDDHSRYAVASHVAWGETAEAAIAVFDKAVAAHGVPQRLLSDNGIALNPSRRGYLGQLVGHVAAAGRRGDHRQALQADHPGQERTLPPDPVPLPRQAAAAETLAELQAQVDAFDHIYNTERPHQGLPGRVTPLDRLGGHARRPTPPRPKPDRPIYEPPVPARRPRPHQPPADLPADTRIRKLSTAGTFSLDSVVTTWSTYDHAFQQVLVVSTGDRPATRSSSPTFDGEILIEHTRPAPGVTYVGNGRPRGPRPKNPAASPKS